MPTLQILQNGQINLPVKFRRDLDLKAGDTIEAEIQDGQIILTPVTFREKSETEERMEAKKRFFEKVDEIRGRTKDVPLQEIQAAIDEAVAVAKQEELNAKD